jgi:iron complex outermembrane receptor protein
VQASVSGFVDLHTSTSSTVFISTKGNPDLKPEVARTYTVGAVFTPSFFPGFSASVDWYKISMDNAIGAIAAGNNTIQRLCEDSGGSSQYCTLFERPGPFSDHSPANFPTKVFNQPQHGLHRDQGLGRRGQLPVPGPGRLVVDASVRQLPADQRLAGLP